MTFYVQRTLAIGPIRFGVRPRRLLSDIDADTVLSTGPNGEFVRKRAEGFFFADQSSGNILAPTLPTIPSISSTPFLSSLKPDGTPRGYGFLALLVFGTLFTLLGLAVVATKGPQGFVEVVLGLAMIATPIIMTAQRRRQIREQEERDRAEREALEKRNRELLSAYSAALDSVRNDPNDTALATLAREREALSLPYELWSTSARQSVLRIGFNSLTRLGVVRAAEVSALMGKAAKAAGLTAEDERATKAAIYQSVVWHLLADDRLGAPQEEELQTIRRGFDLHDEDIPVELKATVELDHLRGLTTANLPRQHCPIRIAFQEYCIHHTTGTFAVIKRERRKAPRFVAGKPCELYVTNRRLVVVTGKKEREHPLPKLGDIDVDEDVNVLTIRVAGSKQPLYLQVDDPIVTAGMLDLAISLDERPRGFS